MKSGVLRLTLIAAGLFGCGGDEEVAVDARVIDAAAVDAPVDAPIDVAEIDAAIDAPIDVAEIDAAIDAAVDAAIDAPIDAPTPDDVVYLGPADELPGTGAWTIGAATTIDTDVIPTGLPAGVTATVTTQAGGPGILILHVGSLQIGSAGVLRLVGSRAFAVVAGDTITIDGRIDAGGLAAVAGAGGSVSGAGPGAGGAGIHPAFASARADSGGGGAGHATAGARGGNAECTSGCGEELFVPGGAAGLAYNAGLAALVGGSGGGAAATHNACVGGPGGGGGGALLLYARNAISVGAAGEIRASGGGGAGGRFCMTVHNTAGAGGGAGGHVELQSRAFTIAGRIGANGGGGGGGADGANSGSPGQDGPAGPFGALGGAGGLPEGGRGGIGGWNTTAPMPGSGVIENNDAGGGGGSVGRIVLRYRGPVPTATTSPPAQLVTF